MKRALITGITGQDGSYLAEALLADGYVIRGLVRRSPGQNMAWAELVRHRAEFASGDLCQADWVERQVAEFVPDEVYHLAFPRRAPARLTGMNPVERFAAVAAPNLLRACERHAPKARILNVVGHDSLAPTAEGDDPLNMRPHNRLAALRLQTHAVIAHHRNHRAQYALTAFVHPHCSPRAHPHALPRRIARWAAAAGLGQRQSGRPELTSETLEYGFAPDYAGRFRDLLANASPKDTVLCDAACTSVDEFAAACFEYVGLRADRFIQFLPTPTSGQSRQKRKAAHSPRIAATRPSIEWREIARLMVGAEIEALRRAMRWRSKMTIQGS